MINEAFLFAKQVHENQVRKNGVAYLVHPFEVAVILAQNGACEELICAGLLHDAIEDADVTEEELRQRFPDKVVQLILDDSEDKSKSWEERKEEDIRFVATTEDRDYKMLMCADKLANIRGLVIEQARRGEDVWKMFHRGKDKQEWFYRSMAAALSDLAGLPMYEELKEKIDTVFKKA